MANKKDIHEVDLTDLDDGFDDLFGSDDSVPLTRIEKAKRVAKGAKTGFIDALSSRSFILNTLNRALPSEYGIDTRVIDDTLNSVDELTREASAEAARVNDALKAAARPLVDKYESKLPKNIREAVKEYVASDAYGTGGLSKRNEEDDFVSDRLSELFATQSAREEMRDEERSGIDAIQTELEHQHRKKTILLTDSMRSSLERLVNFQDKVTSNFQRRSLEIGLRQYFIQAKTLDITRENAEATQDNLKSIYDAVNTPDIVKLREHKDTKRLYGGSRGEKGLFGSATGVADRIRENAQRRAKDAMQSVGMGLGMALGVVPDMVNAGDTGFGDKYKDYGEQAGGMGARLAGTLVSNQLRKRLQGSERANQLGRKSAFFTSNFRNLLEEESRDQDIEYDEKGREKFSARRSISKLLHGLVSDERGSDVLQTDSLESLQSPHPFTKQTNRTINEVIPGLLSLIHQSVEGLRTGEPAGALSYDYLKGNFVTKEKAAKRTVDSLLLRGGADVVQADANSLLDDLDPTKSLSEEDRLELATFMMRQSHDKRLGSAKRFTDASTFDQFDPDQAERFRSTFDNYFSNSDDPDRELNFSRRYNNLMGHSSLTRDDFHALLNTGQIGHLEEAGLVKDGKIDYDAVFRAFMTHDAGSADSDIASSVYSDRDEKESEAKRKYEDAQRASGFFSQGSEKLKASKFGKYFSKGKDDLSEKLGEARESFVSSEVYAKVREQLKHYDPSKLSKEDLQAILTEAQEASGEALGSASGALSGLSIKEATESLGKELKDYKQKAQSSARRGFDSLKSSVFGFVSGRGDTSPKSDQDEVISESNKAFQDKIHEHTGVPPTPDDEVDPGSEFVAEEFRNVGDVLDDKITKILDAITVKFEHDRKQDEGPRRGSYEDIMASRGKKETKTERNDGKAYDEKESGTDYLSGIMGLLGKFPGLGALLGGGAGLSALGGLGGMLGGGGGLGGGFGGGFGGGLPPGAPKPPGKGMGRFMPKALRRAAQSTGFAGKALRGAGMAGRIGLKGAGLAGRIGLGAIGMTGLPVAPIAMAAKSLGAIGKVGFGGLKLGLGAAKFAAPMIASGFMKALPIIAGPVGLAIGGAALAGYGIYKFLTRTKLTELNRIRLTQYGYDPEDLDAMKTMLAFESNVRKALVLSNSGMPSLDEDRLVIDDILKSLDIKEDDQEALQRFQTWVGTRFLPTYLVHVGVLNRLVGKTDLGDIEDLKKDDILEYVKGVRLENGNYDGGLDPKSGDPLPATSETVTRVWEEARDYALTKADKKPDAKEDSAKAQGGLAKTGEDEVGESESRSDVAKEEEAKEGKGFFSKAGSLLRTAVSFTPMGLAAKIGQKFAKGVKDLIVGKVEYARATLSEIGALDAVRFKLYGLTEMNAERVSAILSLEHFISQELEFDSDGKATWEGSLDSVVYEFSGRFGAVPDTPDAEKIKDWLAYRFLPVFTRGMSFLYTRVKATSMAEGLTKIKGPDRLEMAYEMLSTMTLLDGQSISVWLYTTSPWVGSELNTDHTTIDDNLAVLRADSKNVVIPEKKLTTSSAHTSTGGGGLSQPLANQASRLDQLKERMARGEVITSEELDQLQKDVLSGAGLGGASGGGGASGSWNSDTGTVDFNTGTGGLADQLPDPQGDGTFAAYKDMIAAAAKMTGVDPTLLAAMVAVESGFRGSVKASTSSATGLGQFIRATWKAMVKKHGSKYGIPEGTDPKNPKANILMTAEYIKDNAAYLKKNTGKQNLRPVDLYMAHFLGPAGYSRFLNAGPNALGAAVNPSAAGSNASIFYRKGVAQTTSQIVSHFEKSLVKKAKGFGVELGAGLPDNLITEPSMSVEAMDKAIEEPQGLPTDVTASTAVEVANAENQAINQPTATPGGAESSNEFSLGQLGSSYSASMSQDQAQMGPPAPVTPTQSTPELPSSNVSNAYSSFNTAANTRAVSEAQDFSLQQTAINDTASKLISQGNALLGHQLEVQVVMRDTLLKIGDIVAGIAERSILGDTSANMSANGTVPKGQSTSRDTKRSKASFPNPAISMRRAI